MQVSVTRFAFQVNVIWLGAPGSRWFKQTIFDGLSHFMHQFLEIIRLYILSASTIKVFMADAWAIGSIFDHLWFVPFKCTNVVCDILSVDQPDWHTSFAPSRMANYDCLPHIIRQLWNSHLFAFVEPIGSYTVWANTHTQWLTGDQTISTETRNYKFTRLPTNCPPI